MQGAGAAEGHQGELARVVSALDRDGADRAHHVGDDDVEHAARGALDAEPQPPGDRRDGGAREGCVEPHLAGQQPAGREPSEHEVRIRDGGLFAPAPVARGTRLGPRARRPHLEQAVAVEPGDGAATGPHRLDVHRGQADGEAGDVALEGDVGPEVPDQRHVGAGAPHVQGDDVASPGGRRRRCGARRAAGVVRVAGIASPERSGALRDVRGAHRAGRGSRQRGAHRQRPGPRRGHQAPARLVDAERGAGGHVRQRFLQGREVAPQHRLEVGVQHGGGEALVLAELGLDLERGAYRKAGEGGAERGGDAVLVRGVAEREQQADRARLGAARAYLLHRRGDVLRGGLGDRIPVRAHPLVDLEAAAALDQRRRVVLDEGVHVRARLPADLQQVAEALGGDHHHVAPAALDERVGAHGGAVGKPAQPGEVDPVPGGQREQPFDDRPRGVVGGRGPLAGVHRAARLVEGVEVGERPADVDADGPGHVRALPGAPPGTGGPDGVYTSWMRVE